MLREAGRCYDADAEVIEPLWKGPCVPMSACISGWAMRHLQSAVIPDHMPTHPYETTDAE